MLASTSDSARGLRGLRTTAPHLPGEFGAGGWHTDSRLTAAGAETGDMAKISDEGDGGLWFWNGSGWHGP